MGQRLKVTSKLKPVGGGAAKASLNRAISLWYLDVKRDDLGMGRMKRG